MENYESPIESPVTEQGSDEKEAAKRNRKKAILGIGMASVLAIGGVMAYLTATDTVENNFGLTEKIAIEVVEPSWVEADAQALLPTQAIAKDPAVSNTSSAPIWTVMQVDVPTKTVQIEGEDAASSHELVTYAVNDGWTESGTGVYSAETGMTTHTYLYGQKLAAGATTPALFDDITVINMISGQLSADELANALNVHGHAIQAQGFDDVATAWAAYQAQNA